MTPLAAIVTAALLIGSPGAIPPQERAALIAIFESTTQDRPWFRQDNWLGPPGSEGDWLGVAVKDGHVIELQLRDNNLNGTLPPQIGDLTRLRLLDLGAPPIFDILGGIHFLNHIQGPLPDRLGRLSLLQVLDLQGAILGGGDLPDFSSLFSLLSLDLSNLRGTDLLSALAPVWNLPQLRHLDLSRLQLGALPQAIGNLSDLEELDISGNLLETLPASLGSVPLRRLDIEANAFSALPQALRGHPTLAELNIRFNQIGGLPDWLNENVALEILDASATQTRRTSSPGWPSCILARPSPRSLLTSSSRTGA